jgi:hypothetical protein
MKLLKTLIIIGYKILYYGNFIPIINMQIEAFLVGGGGGGGVYNGNNLPVAAAAADIQILSVLYL